MTRFEFHRGCTREVFLVGQYAIKIPSFSCWKHFLLGLIGNLNERTWRKLIDLPGFPPIVYGNVLGLVLVMRRVRPVRHTGLFWLDVAELIATSEMAPEFWRYDIKYNNYGYYKGKLVKIDLG